MLAKLAFRNVRRSLKDYAIYFVTLVLGVAVFYAFDSISAQRILFDIETSGTDMWDMIDYFMTMFSVAVAIVLGILVVYANGYLLKRRKQEFGTYLLLGMKPGQVSLIVLLETMSVGVGSLVVGSLLGIVLSQGLSFLTAGMFGLVMKDYQFVFSSKALIKTILVFAVIFVVVALLNVVQIRRCRLITLLSARQTSEKFKVRPLGLSAAVFVASVVVIALAYWRLTISGLQEPSQDFYIATALMLVGSALFFWSVSGFVLAVVQRAQGVYLKGLSMFTLRQLASRINSACATLWAVCVMLFFSVTAFSTGIGLAAIFSSSMDECTQFDASLVNYPQLDEEGTVSEQEWSSMVQDVSGNYLCRIEGWNDCVENSVQANIWTADITYGQLIDAVGFDLENSSLKDSARALQNGVDLIALSDFNETRVLAGRSALQLADDQYAVVNTAEMTKDLSEKAASNGSSVTVFGHVLSAGGPVVYQEMRNSALLNAACMLVVPDQVLADAASQDGWSAKENVSMVNVNVKYKEDVDRATANALMNSLEGCSWLFPNASLETVYSQDAAGATHRDYNNEDGTLSEDQYAAFNATCFHVFTSDDMRNQGAGLTLLLDYLAIYVGFILLVSTAAILAIQQLSSTSDSVVRYRTLAQLGATRRQIFGSLRIQTLTYFLTPLGLAVCHWACAYLVMSESIFRPFGLTNSMPIALSGVMVVLVYGCYMAVTYFGSRSIVAGSLGKKLLR